MFPASGATTKIAAWKKVTGAVHQKGSYIFLQLWALGRVAMPEVAKLEGVEVVICSPTPLDTNSPPPRELTKEKIREFVQDYAQAARNAMEAGFDWAEVHGAGGYLIDQFTQDNCNTRTDEYGGGIENRSRFILEVARAVVDAVGSKRVGVRLSPWQRFQGMRMEDPVPQFTHVIGELKKLNFGYLHLIEARVCGIDDTADNDPIDPFVDAWEDSAPVILAGGFKLESAKSLINGHFKDKNFLVAFGRYFISNPDLPFRIRHDIPLTPYDRSMFYMPLATQGYADYPFSQEFEAGIAIA
jgi:NADPH2 dehydrogenase